jgi:hypothetical protein
MAVRRMEEIIKRYSTTPELITHHERVYKKECRNM